MQKSQGNRYDRAATQVDRMRKLYSEIGEPLPVDIIIDLHRHLSPALEAVDPPAPLCRKDRKKRMNA